MSTKTRISATALSTFLDCNYKYYLKFVERVEEEYPQFVIDGVNFHKAVEKTEGKESLVSELLSVGFSPDRAKSLSDTVYSYIEGKDIIKEQKVEVDKGDYILTGVFDVVVIDDSSKYIIDWKLSSKSPTISKYIFQASFYSLLFTEFYGHNPDKLIFVNPNNSGKVIYTPDMLSNRVDIIVNDIIPLFLHAKDARARTGIFRGKCRFCGYKEICMDGSDDKTARSLFNMW